MNLQLLVKGCKKHLYLMKYQFCIIIQFKAIITLMAVMYGKESSKILKHTLQ